MHAFVQTWWIYLHDHHVQKETYLPSSLAVVPGCWFSGLRIHSRAPCRFVLILSWYFNIILGYRNHVYVRLLPTIDNYWLTDLALMFAFISSPGIFFPNTPSSAECSLSHDSSGDCWGFSFSKSSRLVSALAEAWLACWSDRSDAFMIPPLYSYTL